MDMSLLGKNLECRPFMLCVRPHLLSVRTFLHWPNSGFVNSVQSILLQIILSWWLWIKSDLGVEQSVDKPECSCCPAGHLVTLVLNTGKEGSPGIVLEIRFYRLRKERKESVSFHCTHILLMTHSQGPHPKRSVPNLLPSGDSADDNSTSIPHLDLWFVLNSKL